MIKVFYSATEKSGELYLSVHSKLAEMSKSQKIELIHFPGFNYIEVQNHFPKAIKYAIEESDVVITLMDEFGRTNQWVNQEVGYAVAHDKEVVILAEDRSQIKGFVNQYTQNIFTGDKKGMPQEIQEWLDEFMRKNEELVYQKIIFDKIMDFHKMVDHEKYKTKHIQYSNEAIHAIDDLEDSIKNIYRDVTNTQFITYFILKETETRLDKIIKENCTTNLRNFCVQLRGDIINAIQARDRKIIELGSK